MIGWSGSPFTAVARPSSTVTCIAQVSGQSCGHAARTSWAMRREYYRARHIHRAGGGSMKGRVVLFVLAAALLWGAIAGQAWAVRYVALGDSYSSGTGTRTYYDSACEKSVYSYPYLVRNAHPSWTFVHAACGGAKTGDVINTQSAQLTSGDELGHLHDRRQRRRLLERHHRVRSAGVGIRLQRGDRRRTGVHLGHAAGTARPREQQDQVEVADGEGDRAELPAPLHGRGLQRGHVVQPGRADAAQHDGEHAA